MNKLFAILITLALTISINHNSVDMDQSPEPTVGVESEVVAQATPSATPAPTSIPKPSSQTTGEVAGATTVTGSFDVAVISLINQVRVENGLRTLNAHPKLNQASQCRINYLIDNGVWSHNGFASCFVRNHVPYHFGENLARQYGMNPQATFDAWMASPGHRANILNPNWRYIGVVSDRDYTVAGFSTGI